MQRGIRHRADGFVHGRHYQRFAEIFKGRDIPTVFSEGHGRESWDDVDVSDTVGLDF
jgi:hypothetical protein